MIWRRRKYLLVFYNARQRLPLRATNQAHLFCWRRYSSFTTIYINAAWPVPWFLLDCIPVHGVVFDTVFLSMHWSPDYFLQRSTQCLPAAQWRCPKVAVAQDEFINMGMVTDFLRCVGVTHVLSCATEVDWPTIYAGLDFNSVCFRTVLTGYVDETRLARLSPPPLADRPMDIGYRAWNNPFWLGEHGQKKAEIGRKFAGVARERGLKIDISNPDSTSFLLGDDWFAFLQRCRAVLGVEGGASIIDRDGSIRRRVEDYLARNPSANFEETRRVCFAAEEGSAKSLSCVSPRHFEAAMTRTCQILLEGNYNGVLVPWRHYIPVKADYSNIPEALDALADARQIQAMVDRTYDELVGSGAWSYRRFVREVEQEILEPAFAGAGQGGLVPGFAVLVLRAYDQLLWRWGHFECSPAGRRVLRLMADLTVLRRRLLAGARRLCRRLVTGRG